MKQVFIVMEGNGESYEDYHAYNVCAFDDEVRAKAHAEGLQVAYDNVRNAVLALESACNDESNALYAAIPYDWSDNEYSNICIGIYEYLGAKYPGVSQLDYNKHSFFVSNPVPFIQ